MRVCFSATCVVGSNTVRSSAAFQPSPARQLRQPAAWVSCCASAPCARKSCGACVGYKHLLRRHHAASSSCSMQSAARGKAGRVQSSLGRRQHNGCNTQGRQTPPALLGRQLHMQAGPPPRLLVLTLLPATAAACLPAVHLACHFLAPAPQAEHPLPRCRRRTCCC